MYRRKIAAILLLISISAASEDFSGQRAFDSTKRIVAFGPRPPGSAAIKKLQAYLHSELQKLKCEILSYSFNANTPEGAKQMTNIIARFRGSGSRAVAVSGHYDTKYMPEIKFVGANDGGSSAGFLLEFARTVSGLSLKKDVYVIWFDGEEAIRTWTEQDSLYGSRNLAEKWAADGTLKRLDALINVDMIGDRDLGILQESGSSGSLRRLIWESAASLGYSRYFLTESTTVGDDHMPFVMKGVNAVDLIDFHYEHWHTANDTMDKLSSRSFQIVGEVILESLRRLGVM